MSYLIMKCSVHYAHIILVDNVAAWYMAEQAAQSVIWLKSGSREDSRAH